MRVLRGPMRSTWPCVPSISMMSPIWIGRSVSRIRPLMKLLTTFWLPKPMPTASAPPASAKAVSGMLTVRSAIRKKSARKP